MTKAWFYNAPMNLDPTRPRGTGESTPAAQMFFFEKGSVYSVYQDEPNNIFSLVKEGFAYEIPFPENSFEFVS
jgi:hypothetical protein